MDVGAPEVGLIAAAIERQGNASASGNPSERPALYPPSSVRIVWPPR
jgi:hypothetical protein